MPLFNWQRSQATEDPEKKEITFKLNEEDQKKIDAAVKSTEELPKIKEQLEGLKGLQAFVEDYKKEKADATAAAARKKQEETQGTLDDEIEQLIITDPKAAIAKATSGQAAAILTLRADNIKREVFEDAEKYKYYHGDIKKEVDALLAAQSLQARNDPSVVENCYKTVVGSHTDEILEGKLKTRFAGSESSSRGTSTGSAGSSSSSDGKKNLPITDDVRKLAKSFGVTPEDYAEMLDKEGIGYA